MLSLWFSLLSLSLFGVSSSQGSDIVARDLSLNGLDTDCSNSTHRWISKNGHCFDEEAGAIPYIPQPKLPNAFGRYLGGLGLSPRDGNCAVDETPCWIVNCCQPGETCGAITVGCVASWSTIYTTTTTTSWSTILEIVTPDSGSISYTATTVSTTDYVTSYKPITLPGPGLDTVVVTSTTTSTSLILSAYTPPTATVTATHAIETTQAPELKRSVGEILPRADLPRRQARTSYTTLTVYVTTYYSAYATSTLSENLVTTTQVVTISSTATKNQTHFATPTGFTTITEIVTSIVSSYAFGTLAQVTQTVTRDLSSSIVAGTTPTDNGDRASQSNPSGAYPPENSHRLSAGAIAGLVVGLILALVLIALIVGMFCCIRRRRNRRATRFSRANRSGDLSDVPSPPSAPTPQPAMSSATPSPPYLNNASDSPVSPTSPIMVGALPLPGRVYHSNGSGNGSRHAGRKSSRSSIVSITPVPEEDEEDDSDEIARVPAGRRNSGDSTRSWGRGYGGRGGYYGGRTTDPRSRHIGTDSPTNPAFRGAIRSTYSDESLIPPHAR